MPWVKRNLYFLVFSAVAVLLLGLSGYYCYSKWSLNASNQKKLDAGYAELNRLMSQHPNPGNKEVNNIEIAKQQQAQLRAEMAREREFFKRIPPIPASSPVTSENFAAALRRTIDQLQHTAAASSVIVPPQYSFSFKAQRQRVRFASGSLQPLAVQLGDIKVICEDLFQAKINSLDNVRRQRISSDDMQGPQSDYIATASVTNDLAVLTPYEVTFHSFSGELAKVLSNLANDPHGLIVRAITVESGSAATANGPGAFGTGPTPANTPFAVENRMHNPEFGGSNPQRPGYQKPTRYTKGGLAIVLDEQPIKVTLQLDVVNLLPKK